MNRYSSHNTFDHLLPVASDDAMLKSKHLNLSENKKEGESIENLSLPRYIPIKKEISPYFKTKKPSSIFKGLK